MKERETERGRQIERAANRKSKKDTGTRLEKEKPRLKGGWYY